MTSTAPRRDVQRDAFILYNSREPGVQQINQRLRDRGITTWFSPLELVPGEDWEAVETEALQQASAVVAFLGPAGWGPSHMKWTDYAQHGRKRIIPAVLGEAPTDAFTELDGLFARLRRVQFEGPDDEAALDELARAIKHVERGAPAAQAGGPRAKPRVDAQRVLLKLIEGDADDREETFDELLALSGTHDFTQLQALILNRLPEFDAARNGAPEVRAALLSALALTTANLETPPPEIDQAFEGRIGVTHEPSADARFAVIAAVIRRGLPPDEAQPSDDPDAAVQMLWEVLKRQAEPEYYAELRSRLQSTGDDLPALLRALRVIPVPALIPDLVSRFTSNPDADVLLALTEPAVLDITVKALTGIDIAEPAATVAATVGRYVTNRMAALISRLDAERIRQQLATLAEGPTDAASGARRLLDILTPDRRYIAGYSSDAAKGRDDLGIALDVKTLCSVMLARDIEPPLSIGLFGDWGTGKSFFMDRMFDEVERTAKEGPAKTFHKGVAQIRFNAWHYIDANLWASLVSYIIEELARQVQPGQDPAEARKTLVTQLETAQELKAQAEGEKRNAETVREEAEKKLSRLAQERADKQIQLADLRAVDLWKLIQDDKELKASLEGASKALGLPGVLTSVEELDDAVVEAHGLGGRVKAVLMAIAGHRSGPLIFALIVVILAFPVAAWALNQWRPDFVFGTAQTLLAQFAAAAAFLAAKIRAPLKHIEAALEKLDAARTRAVQLLDEKRKERSHAEIDLEKQVNELRAKEASAIQQLTEAESRIREIEVKIREIDDGQSFSKYLLQRFQADDYRKHLGLVSTIRRDFENLTALLSKAAGETEPIQRIILYVDDLDRCPAPRVVEVLQAVHLLLAFKLFVVVVGVDPRWLLHALEKSYTAFRADGKRGREWITTPQNYLEKIFQIPFSLQPMGQVGFAKLLTTLLPTAVPAKAANAIPPSSKQPAVTTTEGATPPSQGSTTSSQIAAPSNIAAPPQPPPSTHLNYNALNIRPRERAYAERLFGFIPSPRAAKRFTNVYRLLKARLDGGDLRRFEGTDAVAGEFRAAMLLLAILAGFPESAQFVYGSILDPANADARPDEFFADPAGCGVARSDRERYRRCMGPLIDEGLNASMQPFIEWTPRVARFSFAAAKAVDGSDELEPRATSRSVPSRSSNPGSAGPLSEMS